jgi:hypothetical protein
VGPFTHDGTGTDVGIDGSEDSDFVEYEQDEGDDERFVDNVDEDVDDDGAAQAKKTMMEQHILFKLDSFPMVIFFP